MIDRGLRHECPIHGWEPCIRNDRGGTAHGCGPGGVVGYWRTKMVMA